LARHGFVDDHHTRRIRVVRKREIAPLEERDAKHVEVARRHKRPARETVECHLPCLSQPFSAATRHDERKLPHGFQRHAARRARAHDAGNRLDALDTRARELTDAGARAESRSAHRHTHRDHVLCLEAGIDPSQGQRRQDQQRGTENEDNGERQFDNDEHRARIESATASPCPNRRVLQQWIEFGSAKVA